MMDSVYRVPCKIYQMGVVPGGSHSLRSFYLSLPPVVGEIVFPHSWKSLSLPLLVLSVRVTTFLALGSR